MDRYYLWAFLSVFVLAFNILYPVVIAPLFNTFTPLEDEAAPSKDNEEEKAADDKEDEGKDKAGEKDEGAEEEEEEEKKDDGPRVTVPGLKQGIQDLIAQTGLACKAVFEVDGSRQSSHSNAYVAGMCGSKRIVVYDTLIRDIMDSPGVDKQGIFAIIGQ